VRRRRRRFLPTCFVGFSRELGEAMAGLWIVMDVDSDAGWVFPRHNVGREARSGAIRLGRTGCLASKAALSGEGRAENHVPAVNTNKRLPGFRQSKGNRHSWATAPLAARAARWPHLRRQPTGLWMCPSPRRDACQSSGRSLLPRRRRLRSELSASLARRQGIMRSPERPGRDPVRFAVVVRFRKHFGPGARCA
jgi:hypothetical protein